MAVPKNAPGPLVLIVGEEEFLAERAVSRIIASARDADPQTELRYLTPEGAADGELAELAQPSLFGERRVIVLRSAQDLGKDAVGELKGHLENPLADVTLVLLHAGGKKGKALLDAATQAGASTINCPKPTKYRERIDFIRAEVHGAGRVITEGAAKALLEAVGNDLRELANACDQLVADTAGSIDEDAVARYHQGHAEVSGFVVADRAVEGRTADALEQLRWALVDGVSPVLITSALAQGLRAIAQVGGAAGGGNAAVAKEVGLPPWKVERVRQQLRGWTPEGVSRAIRVVADADAQVKGEGVDAEYALERAVLAIGAARRNR